MQRPAPPPVNGGGERSNQVSPKMGTDPYMEAKQKFPRSFVIETERPDDIPDDGTLVSGITMDHRLIVGARNWNGHVLDDERYENDYEDDDSLDQDQDPSYNKKGPTPSIGGGCDDMKPPGRRREISNDSFGGGRPFGPPKRYASQPKGGGGMMMMSGMGMDVIQQGPTPTQKHQQLLRNNSRKHRSMARLQIDENEDYYQPTTLPSRHLSHQKDNSASTPTHSTISKRNSKEPSRYSNTSLSDEINFQPPSRYKNNENEDYHHNERVRELTSKKSSMHQQQQHYTSNNGNEEYQMGERKSDIYYQSQPQKHLSYGSTGTNSRSKDSSFVSKRVMEVTKPNNNNNTKNGNSNSMKPHAEMTYEYPDFEEDITPQKEVDPKYQEFRKDSYINSNNTGPERMRSSSRQSRYKIDSSTITSNNTNEGKRPPLVSRRGMPDDDCTEGIGRVGRPVSFRSQQQQEFEQEIVQKASADPIRQTEFVSDVRSRKSQQEYEFGPDVSSRRSQEYNFAPDVARKSQEYDFAPDVAREQQEYTPNAERQESTPLSVHDIDEVYASLDYSNRGYGFQCLADLVKGLGKIAKMRIEEHEGVQILVESMWQDMANASIMQSACELLFALTASSDGAPESDMLVGDSAEGAVDALLITMQTHITLESIQRSGCGILHCLASASSNHPEVPDGTLSGAIFMVVNAMAMHRQSQEVQELGIRALYSQCMLSRHSESNKKNLEQSGRDGGAGMDVIRQAMEIAQNDLVTVELAARLYWTLSANEDVARQLMGTPEVANAIIQPIFLYHNQAGANTLIQAAFGALANLARVCDDPKIFRDADLIAKAIYSLETIHNNEALCVEACAFIGVLAIDQRNFQIFASHDVISTISEVMQNYEYDRSLQEETLSTLLCLIRGSDQNKRSLLSDNTMSSLVAIISDERASLTIKEMACNLVGSLCVLREAVQIAVGHGLIDAIVSVLISYPNERKIHEAVFVTMRNITSEGTGIDLFLRKETSRVVLEAMTASTDSVIAQLNACCMLWNICAKAKKDPAAIVSAGAIKQVVRAMQTHMESGEVLEMACGALWCFIDQSEIRKIELLGCGAIDAVTCSCLMHPKEPKTLEKACGLLANVCTSAQMAEAINDSGGISMIVEAMANNSSSMKLLELGALVLRNIVLTKREFAAEASNGISSVIKCMNDNPDAVAFQREACNALWALAAQSEECKIRILALDGVTVLMGALEHNACVGDVQDAARGAISQLALS